MKVIASNKRANYEYFLLKTFTAGIVLQGSEVKSIRAGHASINDTFVTIKNGEAYIMNMYIKPYEYAQNFVPDERRARKLLLNKSEIAELKNAISVKGQTVVPTKLFFDRSLVKVEIAVAKGKKLYDKRETIKQRDLARDAARELRH